MAAGTFADAPPLFVSTATTPVLVGKTIRIQLAAQGAGRSHFDKVRFDSGTVADFTTVTTASDSGPGSLREALAAAAAITGANTITFAPALAGQTITLASEIAVADTGGVTIDASALPTGLTIDGGPGTNRIFRVHSSGNLTLRCLTLTGGNGTGPDASGFGGAIYVNFSTATLMNCTLSGNSAGSSGGAIYNGGTLTLTNCTFSGNSTTVNGGAIYNGNTLTITHCTLSGNSAGAGGAIYNAGPITISNTIAAGNSAPTSANTFGSFTSPNCYIGTDPRLGPLADNGGPTKTMALLPGSPALDAAAVIPGLTTDQRGLPRDRDSNDAAGSFPDIGAYEAQVAPLALGFNFNGTSPRNLLTTERAGAPEFAQTNWNNLSSDFGSGANPRTLSSGASATVSTDWDAPNTWAVNFGTPANADQKLMWGYLDSNGAANSGSDLNQTQNQPWLALASLPAALTLGGYKVVVYADTDTADNRVGEYWLSTYAAPADVSGTTDLSPHFFLKDSASFSGTYTRVPATSTTSATAAAGNYLVFENQTLPDFILRTAESSGPQLRAAINAVQIVRNEILTVTTAADELDPVGTAGTGLSLREAIARAPDGAGIIFDPAVFTGGAANTITLSDTRGEIILSKSVTIDASNLSTGITMDGGPGTNRIFSVDSGKSVALRNLTLTGGNGTGAALSGDGGAILNSGTLLLTQCSLSGNSAGCAGAIFNAGTLTLTQCTLSGNFATNGGVSGIENYGNCTLRLTQCTVSGNISAGTSIGVANHGGSVTLNNSILAGNSPNSGSDLFNGDITLSSITTSLGVNIVQKIQNGFAAGVIGPGTIIDAAPLLAPLGNYGGPTQTMALRSGSPARNATAGSTVTTDQRGFPIVGTPDIGAYEAQIGPIANVTASEGVATAPIPFSVGQAGTLSAASSVPGLVSGFSFGGSGGSRTLTITPAPGQTGTATITVTDSLSGETATFTLTVVPFVPPVVTSGFDSGPGTLRQALADAAAHAGPDTITFAPALNGATITLTGPVNVNDAGSVTLDASSLTGGLTIQRNSLDPNKFSLFNVNGGTSLALRGLTLVNGGGSGLSSGGAIYNFGTLTLTQCTLSGNSAAFGGAIYNFGTLTLTQCTLSGNSSGFNGGAIYNDGTLTLTQCTLSGNFATSDSGGAIYNFGALTLTQCTLSGNSAALGGAIYNNLGTLTLTQSTLSGNSAAGRGGAIDYHFGTLTLTQCSLSGNSATQSGGAINIDAGAVSLQQCTLSGNGARWGAGINHFGSGLTLTHCTLSGNVSTEQGGGIFKDGPLTLADSIVAGNTSSSASNGPDIYKSVGTLTNAGGNLIGKNDTVATEFPAGALAGTSAAPLNAKLAPLANYGGPTQTMALLPGSPARDATAGSTITTDQRGFPIFGTPDIGAYEAQIGPIADVTASEGVATAPIPFSVGQVGTLSAASSVPGLVSGFSFGGSGGSRTLTITPVAGQTGSATITVTDSLSGETATFTLTVVPFVPPVVFSRLDSGPGSLRQALAGAAAHAGPDTITFSIFVPIVHLVSEIVIADTGGVSIDGSAVSGGVRIYVSEGTDRLFSVSAGASLTLTGLTLTGGGGTGAVQSGNGGAIYVASGAAASLVQCRVSGNTTTGPATVGGGIYSHGTLTLTRCSFDGNIAVYEGGAVRSQTSALTAESCTFSGNTAVIGGAISMANGGPAAQFRHCTIAGNTATGIYDAGLGNIGGGGVFLYDKRPSFTGCLMAGNTSPYGPDLQNFAGNPASAGSNLIGNNTGLTWTPLASDKIGTAAAPLDAKLAPLGYYGGPTWTMVPLPGSPAIDAAAAIPDLTTDQRGVTRPMDGDDNGTASSDIGAVEALTDVSPSVQNNSDSGPGSLRQAITNALYIPGPDTITFSPTLSGQTITLASEIEMTNNGLDNMTVDATSLPGGLTIDGGAGTNRIFYIPSGTITTMEGLTLTGGNGTGAANSGFGGAIFNDGTLALTQCTLSGNSANFSGGAIYNFGSLTLTQCTLSGNSAANAGGAIYNYPGTLTLTQCTLYGNSANFGGAIYNDRSVLTLTNSLIAGNIAAHGGPDIYRFAGTITPTGVNLIGNPAASSLTAGPSVIVNSTPGLAPLGNYGGPTQTMALLPGSPARNAASVLAPAITTDQRGYPIVGTPDIGAYEAGTLAPNYNAYIYETLPAAATPAQRTTTFDYDNDGATNFDEWLALTAAADPASRFTLSSGGFTGGNLAFSFPTAPGRNYTLELSSTLAPGSWTPVQGAINLPGDGNVFSRVLGPVTGIPRLYLRVIPSLP